MKIWKRTLAVISALSMAAVMTLSGCGGNDGSSGKTESAPATTVAPTEDIPATDVPTTELQTTEAPTEEASTEEASAPADDTVSPMLWKVQGEKGNVMYLFGTIHLGDERNDKVMSLIGDYVDSCDALAVEFDTVAFQSDMNAMTSVMSTLVYTDGTTAKDHMGDELYQKCVDFLTEEGSFNQIYDYYDDSLWATMVQQALISKSELSLDNAMDTKLLDRAKANGQEILEVESAEFQFGMEKSFSDELVRLQLKDLFDNQDEFIPSVTLLYQTWLRGNEEEISQLMADDEDTGMTPEEKQLEEDYHKAMITDRNIGMAEKADRWLEDGKSVFFAVGAGHMINDEGVVKLLADKGYTVERIYL